MKKSVELFLEMFKEIYEKKFNGAWNELSEPEIACYDVKCKLNLYITSDKL